MRARTPLGAFLFLLASAAGPASAQTPADLPPLLRKIGENQDTRTKLFARCGHTDATRTEDLDSKGKPRSVSETVETVSWENGRQQKRLVRAVKDGRDITQEENGRRTQRDSSKEAAPKSGQQTLSFSLEGPFGLANQPKHRFSIAGPAPGQPGKLRIRFEPRGPAAADTSIGEALVEPSTGTVERIRYHPAVLPAHADRMDVEMEYTAPTPAGLALSSVSIDGEGGILFIRARFRTRMIYSDYACAGTP